MRDVSSQWFIWTYGQLKPPYYNTAASVTPLSSSNNFINKKGDIVIIKYSNLPENFILKYKDYLVTIRIIMPYIEVIKTLYQLGLYPNKGVKDYFFLPDNFNVQGIYCFLSKDSLSYYIGSLISMKTR